MIAKRAKVWKQHRRPEKQDLKHLLLGYWFLSFACSALNSNERKVQFNLNHCILSSEVLCPSSFLMLSRRRQV